MKNELNYNIRHHKVLGFSITQKKVQEAIQENMDSAILKSDNSITPDFISNNSPDAEKLLEQIKKKTVILELASPTYIMWILGYVLLYILFTMGLLLNASIGHVASLAHPVSLMILWYFALFVWGLGLLCNHQKAEPVSLKSISHKRVFLLLSPIFLLYFSTALLVSLTGGINSPLLVVLITLSLIIMTGPRVNSIATYVIFFFPIAILVIVTTEWFQLIWDYLDMQSLKPAEIGGYLHIDTFSVDMSIFGFVLSALFILISRSSSSMRLDRIKSWQ